MTTYYGVVQGNVVILPEDVQIEDGMTVEVRIPSNAAESPKREDREAAFLERLVELGLLDEVKKLDRTQTDQDRQLMQVQGQPLSEAIIAERR